jgi:signal transduction histidine kinase
MTTPVTARPGRLRQLGIDTVYVFVEFILALISFVLLITGFSLGIGLAVLTGGLFILAGTLLVARGLADLERLRIRSIVHRPTPRPPYRQPDPSWSMWRRLWHRLGDGQAWLDFGYGVLRMPLSVVGFSLTVTWWAGTLGGLSYWFWSRWLPEYDNPGQSKDLPELIGLDDTHAVHNAFYLALGAFMLITLPWVVRLSALLTARPAQTLLCDLGDVRAQLVRSQAQTRAAVSAESAQLRRLERDIHDGPQQRLVRLAMDLGRAKQQMESDPDVARATIDEAIGQTRETLDELRTLSRGIAPPILTDRGLASALTAVASRSPIPVALRLDENLASGGRLAAATETATYFAIAEALTNVAKHSNAQTCLVAVTVDKGRVHIHVRDDGQGGAHVAKGHGLAGLADRFEALGGTMMVASPPGGPTELTMELPCE